MMCEECEEAMPLREAYLARRARMNETRSRKGAAPQRFWAAGVAVAASPTAPATGAGPAAAD
jgi:hypothetical protein